MENLPLELLEMINDKLVFFDQLNFKSSCTTFYHGVRIKQVIPNLLIRKHYGEGMMMPEYFISLDKLYLILQKDCQKWINMNIFHDIIVFMINKPFDYAIYDNDADFDLRVDMGELYFGDNKFNMKTFILICLDIANKLTKVQDVV